MFQQHYYPDHNSATDSSHMMHPFYTLGSPYPLYPTFTYSLYDRAHPPHGAFHAPPPQPQPKPQSQPQPQPPHRRSSMESNFAPKPIPNPTHDSRSAYGSRPFTFQRPGMKSYQQPHQQSYPLYYAHHDQDEEQYEHIHPQQQHRDQEREHDYESYLRSHSHPGRMHPRQMQHQHAFTRVHPTQHMYERNLRSPVPNRYPSYPTRNTTYHEDGHGMGLPPFQQECDESEMYPNQIDTHIPTYHEWNDEHEELQNDEDYESQSHRQVPIRVIPLTFTNMSRNNIPLRRRFLIAHKPTRPKESSDSEWDDSPSRTSYQYDPNELSSMLQANPDAIRPLLLQLLPLYEPFLRQALKHDEEKDEDKKKDSIQDKEHKPTTNSKINTNAKTNINTKTNKAGTNANTTTSTSKPPTTTSAGPTKATKGLFSKFTEPEIKKMTPPTTRMRIIHPVQEKESHLEQSQVYKVPSPSPEEMGEQLPPPARPRQLYSFTAHHEEDGKEKKEPVKEKDKPKQQDKKKEVPSTSNKTGSQRNIDIKESSTSRDIPIRGTTSAAASTAPISASASAPSSSTSTTRDTPFREPHEPKPSDISNGTSSTTSRNINIEEKKREQPKKDELKVESDQVPTSTPPPPVAEAPTPATLTSTTSAPSSTLIHPNPHIRRHSPHVEIEDVPSTSAHHAASPVHRHTLSHDSLNPTTTTSTPVTPSATIPTPTPVTPSTITKEDEKVGPMKEEKAKPTTQEQTQDIDTNKPTEEAQKNTTETNIKTDHTTNLDTPTGTTTTESPEVSNQHDVHVTGDATTVYDSPIHSPTSSTYSSILQSCTGSPGVSAPTSPEQQHHRMDSQDHDWHFTSPLMKSNTLNKRNEKMVDMNMMTEDKEYIITITLPEHITKHDIRLDTDVSGVTVESIDDPPMFPSRSLSLPSDADINNLSAKSELIDDFHTILVKIPKRITNKRPIRIE